MPACKRALARRIAANAGLKLKISLSMHVLSEPLLTGTTAACAAHGKLSIASQCQSSINASLLGLR